MSNIWHVTPIDDLKEHIVKDTEQQVLNPVTKKYKTHIVSTCSCHPRIEYQISGDIVIVHNSFDGRESFEWDNDVRKN